MKILVGKILKAQGLKGEVKAECCLDNSALLKNVEGLWVGREKRKIETVRPNGQFCFLKFFGVDDRNSAELLKDWQLYADKSDIQLEENSFFLQDMINCNVFLEDGSFVGEVCDVQQYGSADVYTCKNNGKEISFPWLKDLVVEVNIDAKRIVLCKQRFLEVAVNQDEN